MDYKSLEYTRKRKWKATWSRKAILEAPEQPDVGGKDRPMYSETHPTGDRPSLAEQTFRAL